MSKLKVLYVKEINNMSGSKKIETPIEATGVVQDPKLEIQKEPSAPVIICAGLDIGTVNLV